MNPGVGLIGVSVAEAVAIPTAAPSSVSLYYYSGSLVGVQWASGDASAQTEIGTSASAAIEPSSADATVSAGVTGYDTGETGTITTGGVTPGTYYWVRHSKGGSVTAWVRSTQRLVA